MRHTCRAASAFHYFLHRTCVRLPPSCCFVCSAHDGTKNCRIGSADDAHAHLVCSSFWQICCGMLCTGAWADYPSMNCRCICADLPFIFVFYTACGNRTGSARRSIHYVCRAPAVRWYFRTGRCIRFSVLSRCTASWRTRSLSYILWHKLPSAKLYRGCPPFGSRSCFCASSSRPYTGLTHSFTPITCFYSCRLPVLRS